MIYPATYNVLMPQGATFDRTFTLTLDATPVNLTGYTAALQVRTSATSDDAIISLASGQGIALGGAAGTITITIDDVTTAAVPAGDYVYDLELTSASQKTRLIQGSWTVSGEVTRA